MYSTTVHDSSQYGLSINQNHTSSEFRTQIFMLLKFSLIEWSYPFSISVFFFLADEATPFGINTTRLVPGTHARTHTARYRTEDLGEQTQALFQWLKTTVGYPFS